MIGIIDYGMGNLRSVSNALDYIGIDAEIITEAASVAQYDRVILPGVGAFALAMKNLREKGFEPAILSHVLSGKPFLGICLGMQLLASRGVESGETQGLNLIGGDVIAMDLPREFPIPHVGWNSVELQRPHPIFEGIKKNIDYYFVHSYHFANATDQDVLGITDYGSPFVSVVARDNVVGVQFHPEKSQQGGLALLENFAAWDGKC